MYSVLVVYAGIESASIVTALRQASDVISCVDACRSRDSAKQLRHRRVPDVVVADEDAVISGELVHRIRRQWASTRVLAIGNCEPRRVVAAFLNGAQSYACRSCTPPSSIPELVISTSTALSPVLPGCLRSCHDGMLVVPPGLGSRLGNTDPCVRLTPREHEVAQLLAQGLTNSQVGQHLCISVGTAKWHAKNVLRKLRVRNRLHLVLRYANAEQSPSGRISSAPPPSPAG